MRRSKKLPWIRTYPINKRVSLSRCTVNNTESYAIPLKIVKPALVETTRRQGFVTQQRPEEVLVVRRSFSGAKSAEEGFFIPAGLRCWSLLSFRGSRFLSASSARLSSATGSSLIIRLRQEVRSSTACS